MKWLSNETFQKKNWLNFRFLKKIKKQKSFFKSLISLMDQPVTQTWPIWESFCNFFSVGMVSSTLLGQIFLKKAIVGEIHAWNKKVQCRHLKLPQHLTGSPIFNIFKLDLWHFVVELLSRKSLFGDHTDARVSLATLQNRSCPSGPTLYYPHFIHDCPFIYSIHLFILLFYSTCLFICINVSTTHDCNMKIVLFHGKVCIALSFSWV